MSVVCPNYWQSYGCEWSASYLWRWMNWVARTDVLVLAVLLVCILVVAVRVYYCCHLRRSEQRIEADSRTRGKLAADLNIELGRLRSIASIAPYLGLVGACVGVLSAFGGIAMEMHMALAMISSRVAAALVTTAAGILVAVPATIFYNYLHTRIDLLEREASSDSLVKIGEYRRIAPRFPLRKRFSGLPAFALIAAPTLAILVAAYMTFASFHPSTGLGIELASGRCGYDGDEPIVLRLTGTGGLLLNNEHQDWNSLESRLSEIYNTRVHRTLYLLADNGLPYRSVVDVIDIVENGLVIAGPSGKLNITVRLLTARAISAPCAESRE